MNLNTASPLEAFKGPVRSSPGSFFYSLGMLFVAGAMAILPLIYVGLIALAGWAVYWHAANNYTLLTGDATRGRAVILFAMLYFGPLFVGCVILFFMIKPLLARRSERAQPYALNPENEPLLYE